MIKIGIVGYGNLGRGVECAVLNLDLHLFPKKYNLVLVVK